MSEQDADGSSCAPRCTLHASEGDQASWDRQEPLMKVWENAAKAASATERVSAVDWSRVEDELDRFGCAVVEQLLTPQECGALAANYARDDLYRSRVVMER